MVINIPEGVYTMQTKRSIVKTNARQYRTASKKVESAMLDDLSTTTHFHCKYLTMLLNNTGKVYYTPQGDKLVGDPTITYTHKRGRKKVYTEALVPYLVTLWELSGFRSSIHLVYFIRHNKELLYEKPPDFTAFSKEFKKMILKLLSAPAEYKDKLLKISSASAERRLKPIKAKLKIAHKYKPHPHASVIKKMIPVEPYFKKPKGKLSYTEVDLVHHCGAFAKGGFCYTLSEVEINTTWTELRALTNKAHTWTQKALTNIDKSMPFRIHTRHSDNGAEFINGHLLAYAREKGIKLTRSRDYHKNDAPYVESRHWTMVRSYLGYRRYDTEAEYTISERLMPLISLRHNYFIPTMKLVHKERIGGKVRKKYEIDTPFNRVLHVPAVTQGKKQELQEYKSTFFYLKIVDEIDKLQKQLDKVYHKKQNPMPEDEERLKILYFSPKISI